MIYVDKGKEQEQFISFIEHALSILAEENYASFLTLFDSSRLTEQDLILALKYLDESRSTVKVDNPTQIKRESQIINMKGILSCWMIYIPYKCFVLYFTISKEGKISISSVFN